MVRYMGKLGEGEYYVHFDGEEGHNLMSYFYCDNNVFSFNSEIDTSMHGWVKTNYDIQSCSEITP